jgi:hypothetical protein
MDQGRRVDSRYPRTEEVEDRGRVAHASQLWEDLIGRVGGPMTFRLICICVASSPIQPKGGQLPKDGWKSVGFVVVFAIVIDGVYQFIVFRWCYPGEALTVAIVLAIVPYLQIRGLANSIARDSIKSKGRESNPVI